MRLRKGPFDRKAQRKATGSKGRATLTVRERHTSEKYKMRGAKRRANQEEE